jgi:hypothetical protein
VKRALPEIRRWTSHDAAARVTEVEALANMLNANRFSAATVADFGVGQWHMAALVAQVHDPSPETRAIVVRILQDKEAARAVAELGFSGAAAGTAANDSDRVRAGGRESALSHHLPAAFDGWLAGYRGRLERRVKNARRK